MPATLDNGDGALDWYKDRFGAHGTNAPFTGSVRQHSTKRRLDYSTLTGNLPIDPRVTDRQHDDGGGSVHAPN